MLENEPKIFKGRVYGEGGDTPTEFAPEEVKQAIAQDESEPEPKPEPKKKVEGKDSK